MAARGACYGEGCHNKSICSYSAAGGPTTFKSGVCDVDRNRAQLVLTRFGQVTGGGAYAVCTCAPHFCISRTARPITFKFGVLIQINSLSINVLLISCSVKRKHIENKCQFIIGNYSSTSQRMNVTTITTRHNNLAGHC